MKNKKIIYVIMFLIGLVCGTIIGINIGLKIQRIEDGNRIQDIGDADSIEEKALTQKNTNSNSTTEKVSFKNIMSEDEINKLKETIEKDEADYGDKYQKLEGFEYTIKRQPDRIYFKSSKVNGFYCFEKNDENYNHIVEVIEDRMFYSTVEDYNLYCFTPDSIDKMLVSGDNYIIYDYDNGDLSEVDNDFQKDIIFRFPEKTRLYRLLTYFSYPKEMLMKDDIGKSEFAVNTEISGYKYMRSIED